MQELGAHLLVPKSSRNGPKLVAETFNPVQKNERINGVGVCELSWVFTQIGSASVPKSSLNTLLKLQKESPD